MYHFFKRPTRTRRQRKFQEREILAFLVKCGLVDPQITYRQAARKISKLMYQRRNLMDGALSSCLLIDEDGPEATYYISVVNRRVLESVDRSQGQVSDRMARLAPEPIVNVAPKTAQLGATSTISIYLNHKGERTDQHGNVLTDHPDNNPAVTWTDDGPVFTKLGTTDHIQRRNAGKALKNSSILVDVNGKERRVVQEVTDSGIVNLVEVADDGSTRPLTGMFSFGICDVSTRADPASTKFLGITPEDCPWLKPSDFSLRPAGGIPANPYGTGEFKPIPEIGDLITVKPKEDPNAG